MSLSNNILWGIPGLNNRLNIFFFLVGDNHELNMLLSDVFIKFLSECLRLEYLRLEMTRRVILAEKVAQCLHLIFLCFQPYR